jgi:hypothetical protein
LNFNEIFLTLLPDQISKNISLNNLTSLLLYPLSIFDIFVWTLNPGKITYDNEQRYLSLYLTSVRCNLQSVWMELVQNSYYLDCLKLWNWNLCEWYDLVYQSKCCCCDDLLFGTGIELLNNRLNFRRSLLLIITNCHQTSVGRSYEGIFGLISILKNWQFLC